MTGHWQWRYFLADEHHDIVPGGDHWSRPIPLSASAPDPDDAGHAPPITYGDYFSAVRQFLAADNGDALCHLPPDLIPLPFSAQDVAAVHIYLVKHGAFYHPARVEVHLADRVIQLAVNVAVSENGRRMMPQEVAALGELNNRTDYRRVPRVFSHGMAEIGDRPPLGLFLCDWFAGYHEFHLTLRDAEPDRTEIVVWDAHGGRTRLKADQKHQLYGQAAAILTAYYDVETSRSITAWHHAAGDFVVNLDRSGRVDVRLVTVRQYAPMIQEMSPDAAIEALLLFFIDMSLRMRLDRLDGVGDPLWAPDNAVDATLDGFFAGLQMKTDAGELPEGFADAFHRYLARSTTDDLASLTRSVIARHDPHTPDHRLMTDHMRQHVTRMAEAIGRAGRAIR